MVKIWSVTFGNNCAEKEVVAQNAKQAIDRALRLLTKEEAFIGAGREKYASKVVLIAEGE